MVRARCEPETIRDMAARLGGTADEILVELLHNARRAGATRIEIESNGFETSVSDDGHGIRNAAVLLHAGASEWWTLPQGEHAAAGIGFYALSRSPHVHVDSLPAETSPFTDGPGGRWTMDLTPTHFQGTPAAVTAVEAAVGEEPGTVVTWRGMTKEWAIEDVARYFPLPVSLNGRPITTERFVEPDRTVVARTWRGLWIAAYPRDRKDDTHLVNVHGTVARLDVRTPAGRHVARVEVLDCPELRLRRPGLASVLDDEPFNEELRRARCRSAYCRPWLS